VSTDPRVRGAAPYPACPGRTSGYGTKTAARAGERLGVSIEKLSLPARGGLGLSLWDQAATWTSEEAAIAR